MASSRRLALALVGLVVLAEPAVAGAQDRGGDCQLLMAGNGIYTIHAWGDGGTGCDVGAYGVLTGPDHPAGPDLDLLQEGELPDTSFNTVHSFSTDSTYVLSDGSTFPVAARGGLVTQLSSIGEASVVDGQTIEITYDLDDLDLPDDLIITITIEVTGTTIDDSRVNVFTKVLNPAPAASAEPGTSIGVRYLWDQAVNTLAGLDAGPNFVDLPNGLSAIAEVSYVPPPAGYLVAATETAEYFLFGSGLEDPEGATAPPSRLDYVCAPEAAQAAFVYDLQGLFVAGEDTDCSPDPTGDSGIAYYWEQLPGAARGGGILLDENESFTAGASLWSARERFESPALCLTLELDATQVAAASLGIAGLQNNDVVCSDTAFVIDTEPTAARGNDEDLFDLLFDGSDVGITRTIIDGLDIREGADPFAGRGENGYGNVSDVLLSFNQAHSIPPLGLVLQADIVRFVPEQLGSQTQGHFERFFDGSDIGLEAGGEDIDAFFLEPELLAGRGNEIGDLYFSTRGNLSVPGLEARDEDIVVCREYRYDLRPGGDIESSCDDIELFFDGSEAGLANASEDVDAFVFTEGLSVAGGRGSAFPGDLYLSTRGNFNVNGVSGRNEDVFRCTPSLEEIDDFSRGVGLPQPITACENVEIVFDGSQFGLGKNNVFSIDLLPPEEIICADRVCLQR